MRQTPTPKFVFFGAVHERWRRGQVIVGLLLLLLAVVFVFRLVTQRSLFKTPEIMAGTQSPSKGMANFSSVNSNQTTVEDYAVYSAVLSDPRYLERSVKLLLIKDRTFTYDPTVLGDLVAQVPGTRDDTVKDFALKNREVRRLENRFKLDLITSILNSDDFDEMMARDLYEGWRVVHENYPNSSGVISLSSVGFNREGTQAIVYIRRGCGPTCGESKLFVLTKDSGVWSVQSNVTTSVS
jgi:hypothetical protein